MNNSDLGTSVGIIAAIGICCLLCGGCGLGLMKGGFEYSEGYREGTIQKFSHKGVIFKTQEGELAMSGWKKQGDKENPTMTNVFEFTVEDAEIANQIKSLHGTEKVRLYYKQYFCVPSWRGETQYFIVKIEKVGE